MIDTSKVYTSNNYGDFKITKYNHNRDVEVEFISTGYVTSTQSVHIIRGSVKDPMYPSICGVGFYGEGVHKATKGKAKSGAYMVWSHMIERCYSSVVQKKNPSYIGVTVCKEWHNFQNFAAWFELNYIDGLQVDKDIKQRGVTNKVYSPETCLFVSQKKNSVEASAKSYILIDPNKNIVRVYNLKQFCADNNLTPANMHKVLSGERPHHKGWAKA